MFIQKLNEVRSIGFFCLLESHFCVYGFFCFFADSKRQRIHIQTFPVWTSLCVIPVEGDFQKMKHVKIFFSIFKTVYLQNYEILFIPQSLNKPLWNPKRKWNHPVCSLYRKPDGLKKLKGAKSAISLKFSGPNMPKIPLHFYCLVVNPQLSVCSTRLKKVFINFFQSIWIIENLKTQKVKALESFLHIEKWFSSELETWVFPSTVQTTTS